MTKILLLDVLDFYAASKTDDGRRATRYLKENMLTPVDRIRPPVATADPISAVEIYIDGDTLRVPRPPEVFTEGDLTFSVARTKFKGLLVLATWERYKESTRVTVALTNGFAHEGTFYADDVRITSTYDEVDTYLFSTEAFTGIQVRGTFVRRQTSGQQFHEATVDPQEPWMVALCRKGHMDTFAPTGYKVIGHYRIGDPGVKGESSLNGSHGGWELGPYHFGTEGWQRCCPEGYKWAEEEFFNTLARSPLASYNPDNLEPHNPRVPYWCGRASSDLPGLEVGSVGPEENENMKELHKYQAPAHSHMHRATASAAMLAPRDVFARIVLVEHYWNDFTCNLDGGRSNNPLFNTYQQVMEKPGGQGWSEGGRGFAHLVGCFTMASEWMHAAGRGYTRIPGRLMYNTSDGTPWAPVLRDLIRHVAWLNSGVVHNKGSDHNSPGTSNPARSREIDLLFRPMQELGGLADILTKVELFMSPLMANNERLSPAATVDGSKSHWTIGHYAGANYYPWYDLIRGDMHYLDTETPKFSDPSEQLVALVNPSYISPLIPF